MRISTLAEREWAYAEYSYGRLSWEELVEYIKGRDYDKA